MKNKKTSLVLEGGGMRGAFTAGALSWLVDNNIEFDNAYGISTGAVHLCSFLKKSKEDLESFSTIHIADKRVVGLKAFLKCGKIVNYNFLFQDLMPNQLGFSMNPIKENKTNAYIGLYELQEGKTFYHSAKEMSLLELQAACTLPILGGIVNYNGRNLLDGGITDMIPIEESIKDGCTAHLVISTKPITYVRKPAKKAIVKLMKHWYPSCKQISKDYEIRHINFKKQIDTIKQEVEKENALYIYPTIESKVTRLGGTHEQLLDLYYHGYKTMEEHKEEILHLLKKD